MSFFFAKYYFLLSSFWFYDIFVNCHFCYTSILAVPVQREMRHENWSWTLIFCTTQIRTNLIKSNQIKSNPPPKLEMNLLVEK